MILSRRIALNGNQLDEIHERVAILSIDTSIPNETVQTVSLMGGYGQRVTAQHWETMEVTVTYGIDVPKTEMETRRAIYEAVNAWARQMGWLTVSYMPGRRLYVDKVVYPSSGDMRQWTNEYPITFRAYNVPFWQDEQPAQAVSEIRSSGRLMLSVGGDVKTPVNIRFENKSGMSIATIQISAGGNTIKLQNLNLSGSGVMEITHTETGLLKITADGTSAYHKYSGSDDLMVNPGNVYVDFSASRAGIWKASAYGRYI